MEGWHENLPELHEGCPIETGMEVLSQRADWTARSYRDIGQMLQRNSANTLY